MLKPVNKLQLIYKQAIILSKTITSSIVKLTLVNYNWSVIQLHSSSIAFLNKSKLPYSFTFKMSPQKNRKELRPKILPAHIYFTTTANSPI